MEWREIDRRRLGTGLLVFGVVGVVLAGLIALALLGGAIAARSLDERLVADQDRIAASLTRLTLTMDTLALSTDHAGATLVTSRDAVTHASDLLGELSSASDELATALDVDILGTRPFASAAARIRDVATRTTTLQKDTAGLALNLDSNASDVAIMSAEIRALKTQTAELAGAVAGFDRIDQIVGLLIGGIVLGGLLTAWVAMAAGACAWAGWRLRRAIPAVEEGASDPG